MTASLLAVKNNSLLPSQSIFNEIQSIHDTGFFHEIESMSKECGLNLVSMQAWDQAHLCVVDSELYFQIHAAKKKVFSYN